MNRGILQTSVPIRVRLPIEIRLHVLDEILMAWAVDVGIMSLFCLVLDVSSRDGDTTSSLFRCLVDLRVVDEFVAGMTFGHGLGDSSGEGSFSMIDVACSGTKHICTVSGGEYFLTASELTNGTDIHMLKAQSKRNRVSRSTCGPFLCHTQASFS